MDEKGLRLDQSYEFKVFIDQNSNTFFGELNITPEGITLVIRGESHEHREFSLLNLNYSILRCYTRKEVFILHELRRVSYYESTINRLNNIGYFETKLQIGYLIYLPTQYKKKFKNFTEIIISSSTIAEWLGKTSKQHEIIETYNSSDSESIDSWEFFLDREEHSIGVYYARMRYESYQPYEISSKFTFHPQVSYQFNSIDSSQIKDAYDKVYTLFAFLTGGKLHVEKVICSAWDDEFYKEELATFYYPTFSAPKALSRGMLCPFKESHDKLIIPPLDAFDTYFSLSKEKYSLFFKHLKYKKMANPEDRLLGFFRLLESLCMTKKNYLDPDKLSNLACRAKPYLIKIFKDKKNVESFIKGLAWYNNSKYNTEKCLKDFFVKIPRILTDHWILGTKDFKQICKLRNDIVHANQYCISEQEILRMEKFIEVLLNFALFSQLGVNVETTASFIDRLEGYSLLLKGPNFPLRVSCGSKSQ